MLVWVCGLVAGLREAREWLCPVWDMSLTWHVGAWCHPEVVDVDDSLGRLCRDLKGLLHPLLIPTPSRLTQPPTAGCAVGDMSVSGCYTEKARTAWLRPGFGLVSPIFCNYTTAYGCVSGCVSMVLCGSARLLSQPACSTSPPVFLLGFAAGCIG